MSGRHEQRPAVRVRARWLVALAALVALLVALVAPGSASAASKTEKTQLTLTGLATSDSPTGGSVIGIRPGDRVSLTTSTVPTRGLDKLGLGDLVGGLLNSVVGFQATVDFSNLPGGKSKTVLKSSPAKTFTFNKVGTYTFTYSMQKVTVGLLGKKVLTTINLNGNQLEKAGVKLNAGNEYIGKIVVAKNPPRGGISIQLPKVSAAPSVPVAGQLPTVSLPGVNAPTVHTTVPNLNPTKKSTSSKTSKPSSGSSSSSGFDYTPPGLSIPDQVVPQGDGGGGYADGGSVAGGGGGGFNGVLPDTGSVLGSKSGSTSSGAGSQALPASKQGNSKTVDLATSSGKPSSQVPVVLALLAIIALALVAGTYARLFLLKKQV